jgi:hypothetical protein
MGKLLSFKILRNILKKKQTIMTLYTIDTQTDIANIIRLNQRYH